MINQYKNIKPKAGDTVRVRLYGLGDYMYFKEYILDEVHYCLGVYLNEYNRLCNIFTTLSDMYEPVKSAGQEHLSNCGRYYKKYVYTYDVISKDKELVSDQYIRRKPTIEDAQGHERYFCILPSGEKCYTGLCVYLDEIMCFHGSTWVAVEYIVVPVVEEKDMMAVAS